MTLADFSRTERIVARKLASGLKPKAIAALMGVSVRTTNMHIGNIYKKMGVHSFNEFIVAWPKVAH